MRAIERAVGEHCDYREDLAQCCVDFLCPIPVLVPMPCTVSYIDTRSHHMHHKALLWLCTISEINAIL